MAPQVEDHGGPGRRGKGRLHEGPTRRHVGREAEGDVLRVGARELQGAAEGRSGMTASVGHGLFSRLRPRDPPRGPFLSCGDRRAEWITPGFAGTTLEPCGTFPTCPGPARIDGCRPWAAAGATRETSAARGGPRCGSGNILVVPLDLGHREQAIDEIGASAPVGEPRRQLVLADVAALEPTRAVHRQEPPGEVAEEAECPADQGGAHFEPESRSCPERAEDLAHEAPVMPLLFLDRSDARAVVAFARGAPVAPVRERRGELSRVRLLEQASQRDATVPATRHAGEGRVERASRKESLPQAFGVT